MSLPRVRVEVGFTTPYVGDFFTIGDPIRGQIGVMPIGADEIWSDISAYVRSWSIRRGVSQGNAPSRRYEASTCSIVLNDGERIFDPDNLDSPFASGGETQIEPMRRVRIVAEYAGIAYPLFQGYSDDWVPDYQGGFWTYTTLTATDAFKIFSGVDRVAVGGIGAGELTGARMTRILNSIDWPVEDRVIDTGETAVQATVLEGNTMQELQLTTDTEHGEFFVDALGRAVFQSRTKVLTEPRSRDSQATFGDGGYPATDELPYADVKLSTSDDGLANRVTITRAGGTPQIVEDSDSISDYLIHTFEQSELTMQTDTEALNIANAILHQHATPVRRISRVEFVRPTPQVEAVVWPAILDREFGDRITVIRRPAGGGDPIQRDAFVRGIEHSSDGQQWSTALVCQAADRYSFFTIGHSDLGRIGAHPLAF